MQAYKHTYSNIETKLRQLEVKYGVPIPEDYKEFLKKYNGGYTPSTTFSINRISNDIIGFFGLGDVPLHIEELGEDFLSELIREYKVFPIAKDSLGNYIVISADNKGNIYFYDHEIEPHLKLLSNDLKSFIAKCKSGKIPEIATKTVDERRAILTEKGRAHFINDILIAQWQEEYNKYSGMTQEKVVL